MNRKQSIIVRTLMGDCLQVVKPSQYVTATEVNSAFYPSWDGRMSIRFQAEVLGGQLQEIFAVIKESF